jgi:hypothetical protein
MGKTCIILVPVKVIDYKADPFLSLQATARRVPQLARLRYQDERPWDYALVDREARWRLARIDVSEGLYIWHLLWDAQGEVL